MKAPCTMNKGMRGKNEKRGDYGTVKKLEQGMGGGRGEREEIKTTLYGRKEREKENLRRMLKQMLLHTLPQDQLNYEPGNQQNN